VTREQLNALVKKNDVLMRVLVAAMTKMVCRPERPS
jgi:hypothetical protein